MFLIFVEEKGSADKIGKENYNKRFEMSL
jgi:hypothetical protein